MFNCDHLNPFEKWLIFKRLKIMLKNDNLKLSRKKDKMS